ncbi:MAG: ABC transporter ATP-binding protein [Candidatus Dormibacteraeota bacterium]|nr:ABC transporter ATP-binding protein [Candidatus Dormibacteraeota bacterium]
MATAIAFQHVSKRFRNGRQALSDVSWAVAEGARTCLLGPNGAGKSTSIRLLLGALSPTAGSVELLGAAVGVPAYWEARRRTGIVPQGPGMYPDLTAGEYLDLAARLYGARSTARTVDAFGLGPHLASRMTQLSGGFQRRVVLAAALVAEPDVLLLDEPTVGLDPVAADDVHSHLRELMQGRTAVLCTHNLAEAESLCDEVVILNEGRVVVQDRLQDLRRRSGPRLRIRARQGAAAVRAALDGAAETDRDSVLIAVTDPPAEAPTLLRRLLGAGLDVYECAVEEATLHEVFLEAVR